MITYVQYSYIKYATSQSVLLPYTILLENKTKLYSIYSNKINIRLGLRLIFDLFAIRMHVLSSMFA